jgi:predicted RNA-binding protein associated with RNAse of E/G family
LTQVRVLKLDLSGAVTWAYSGTLIERRRHRLTLQALFDIDRVPVADVVLRKGDRFVETYYDGRMYNVFKVFEGPSGPLKGWYCNICRPAVLQGTTVAWVDLALDLWVGREGGQFVLDRDEFAALDLDLQERQRALAALARLERGFSRLASGAPRRAAGDFPQG